MVGRHVYLRRIDGPTKQAQGTIIPSGFSLPYATSYSCTLLSFRLRLMLLHEIDDIILGNFASADACYVCVPVSLLETIKYAIVVSVCIRVYMVENDI